ncbi:unnamed protein product, partial [Darwinula stevensoni]
MPSIKRKRNVLTIETKLEIIDRLAKGESGSSLATLYNVGKATITDKQKEAILQYAAKLNSEDGSKRRKSMKGVSDTALEDALFAWFTQKRSLADAVDSLTEQNVIHAWKKLWPDVSNFIERLPGFKECDEDDVREWLETDVGDPGFQILTEDEIVDSVKAEATVEGATDEEACDEQDNKGPTHAEAFAAFETVMAWCERQSECCSTQLLLLKRMRDLAAKKKALHMLRHLLHSKLSWHGVND